MRHDPPTQHQLEETYNAERVAHPRWPDTFEAAMADPLTAGVIGGLARARMLRVVPPRRHDPELQPAVLHLPARRVDHGRNGRRVLDFKSRAAGERSDD